MVLAIAVMQFRVNGGNTIEVFEKKGESQGIAAVVRYVLDALKELWQIELQENEYLWLSDIFYQIQILNTQNMTKAAVLGYTYPVCHNIVREMLQQVKNVYGLDFTTDDRLFADLCVHVQTLKNGIIAPQIQHHVFGDELRNRYPLLGDICHFLKNRLGQECEVLLGKDEEDYLLPFLISAQRTLYQKIRGRGLSTVVISHFNGSVTHFLMEQLKKFYGDILDLHRTRIRFTGRNGQIRMNRC